MSFPARSRAPPATSLAVASSPAASAAPASSAAASFTAPSWFLVFLSGSAMRSRPPSLASLFASRGGRRGAVASRRHRLGLLLRLGLGLDDVRLDTDLLQLLDEPRLLLGLLGGE